MMEHSFDIEMASVYGIEEAIIIQHFKFWIIKNRANSRHNIDGRTWTYTSARALTDIFPYMSESKIRRVMDSLVEKGVLMKGNFNKSGYDRTAWYSFQNEQMHLPKSANASCKMENPSSESARPIPDTLTDINTDKSNNTGVPPVEPVKEKPMYSKCIDVWYEFFKSKSGGLPPKIDGSEGKAMKSIIHYLETIDKVNGADFNLTVIFANWDKLDKFTQKMVTCKQINFSMSNIIIQLNNGSKYAGSNLSPDLAEYAQRVREGRHRTSNP